jgi:hypothetical protein
MNLDDDLRRAFRRKPAPPDLADNVLARIAEDDTLGRLKPAPTVEEEPANTYPRARMPVRRWLAAAAAMTLVAAGGARYYLHQQTVVEAERVQAEIRLAFQITGEKLAMVQQKIQDLQR